MQKYSVKFFSNAPVITRNFSANLFGSILIALITLFCLPIQAKLLGIEVFGLLGFITAIQVLFVILDFGLAGTVLRQLAINIKSSGKRSQYLIYTSLSLFWGMAILIGSVIFFCSDFFVNLWFPASSQNLKGIDITKAIKIAAFIIAIRWPVGFYSSVLIGTRKIVVLNYLKISSIFFRLVLGLLIIEINKDINFYLYWLLFCSILEVISYHICCQKLTDYDFSKFGYSIKILYGARKYTLLMGGMGILGGVIPIMDRLVISKVLPLADLGVYTLIYTMATSISLMISSMSSVLVPAFAKLHSLNNVVELKKLFNISSKAILYLTSLVLFPLVFYGDFLYGIWAPSSAIHFSQLALSLLSLGFWLSAAISTTANLAIATNRVNKIFIYSLISGLVYIPVLYFLTLNFGQSGAAAAWLTLNFFYLFSFTPIIQKEMLETSLLRWIISTIVPIGIAGILFFGVLKFVFLFLNSNNIEIGWFLLVSFILHLIFGYYIFQYEINDVLKFKKYIGSR